SRRTFSVPLLIRATALVSHATLFLNDTAPTETYTLSLHDALPISARVEVRDEVVAGVVLGLAVDEDDRELGEVLDRSGRDAVRVDRKSTRLNSSHVKISYAVFCLKKKTIIRINASPCKELHSVKIS